MASRLENRPVSEEKRALPSLRRNFSWSFFGNGFYALSQWAMITVLAKIGTQEMVGQFALGLAIATPIILFTNMQLSAVQVTDAKREYVFGDYMALRLITVVLALVAIAVVAAVSQDLTTVAIVLLVAVAKSFESLSEIFYGLYMQKEAMDRLAGSLVMKGALAVIGLAGGVYVTGSLVWGILGMAFGWFLVLVVYDLRNGAALLKLFPERNPRPGEHSGFYAPLRPEWSPAKIWKLAKVSLPMGVVIMLLALNTNVPRYFVEHFEGADQLGIFAAISYVVVAGYMFLRAAGQSVSPRMARYYSEGDEKKFVGITLLVMGLSATIGIVGVLAIAVAGKQILTVIYTAEYANDTRTFLWMMVVSGLSFMVSALGFAITSARYFWSQVPLLMVSSGSTALACWWLVPDLGLLGAAYALLIGTAFQFLGSVIIMIHAVYTMRINGALHVPETDVD